MESAAEEGDPFMQGHSKLYQRRKEIQEELRKEFNLPEEDVLREVLSKVPRPLLLRPPPPVPKPRMNPKNLPRIPRVLSEPPRQRWGNIQQDRGFDGMPCSPKEQEEEPTPRRHSSADLTPKAAEEHRLPTRQARGPAPAVPPLPSDWKCCAEQTRQEKRPHSWRQPRLNQPPTSEQTQPVTQLGPTAHSASPSCTPRAASPSCTRPSTPRSPHIQGHAAETAPHVEKARELEELARAHQQRQRERQEEEQCRAAEREAVLAAERRAREEERERRRHLSERQAQEAKRQEEQQFEQMCERELRLREREAEDVEKRRKEQEEWERDIRKRFKEEELLRNQKREQEVAAELERQAKTQAETDQGRSESAQQQPERSREQGFNMAHQREQERERWRRQLQEEAERQRAAAAAEAAAAETERLRRNAAAEAEADRLRKNIASEAERLKRKMAQPPFFSPSPPAGRGRRYFRPEDPSASSNGPGLFRERSFGGRSSAPPSAPPSAPSSARRPTSVPAVHTPADSLGTDERLRQAEQAAMQQLRALQRLPSKDERQRGFKDLLRAWHPDKNPQNVEVATAVFQLLQAERKKVLS